MSFFILHGLKYLGINFLINKNHEEKLKKEQVYAKYVDIRLVVLMIMFEAEKLYFWWMHYIYLTL